MLLLICIKGAYGNCWTEWCRKKHINENIGGEIIPDKGDIKWQPNIQIGHLDQYAEIDEGYTISQYLKRAFYDLYEMEKRMNKLYEESAMTGDENQLLKAAEIQGLLEARDFYSVDSITNKVATGLGIDVIGMNRVIGELSGGACKGNFSEALIRRA